VNQMLAKGGEGGGCSPLGRKRKKMACLLRLKVEVLGRGRKKRVGGVLKTLVFWAIEGKDEVAFRTGGGRKGVSPVPPRKEGKNRSLIPYRGEGGEGKT